MAHRLVLPLVYLGQVRPSRRQRSQLTYGTDFALALFFGIFFQYFSIAPATGEYGLKTIWRATTADFLSLVAFEIGLFGWMAIFQIAIFRWMLEMTTVTYWFMMQVSEPLVNRSSYMLTTGIDRHVLWTLDGRPHQLVAFDVKYQGVDSLAVSRTSNYLDKQLGRVCHSIGYTCLAPGAKTQYTQDTTIGVRAR